MFFSLYWALRVQSWLSHKMHLIKPQIVSFEQFKSVPAPILDLGGGGAGVIGRLFGKAVTAVDLRQSELDETPNGPIKVVADARNLPFESNHFATATAFYFFMYLNSSDYLAVLNEAYRTLAPGGDFYIWDTVIQEQGTDPATLFAVPVAVKLPNQWIKTAYGVSWKGRLLNATILEKLAETAGFIVQKSMTDHQNAFLLLLHKSK